MVKRVLWLIAVLLYLTSIGVQLAGHRPLGPGDALGFIVLAVVGWGVLRKP